MLRRDPRPSLYPYEQVYRLAGGSDEPEPTCGSGDDTHRLDRRLPRDPEPPGRSEGRAGLREFIDQTISATDVDDRRAGAGLLASLPCSFGRLGSPWRRFCSASARTTRRP